MKPHGDSARDEAVQAIEKNLQEAVDQVRKTLNATDWPSPESRLAFVTGLLHGASWRALDDLKKAGVIK